MVPGTSLRERQKAQTRQHLLDVAADLIHRNGYVETTVEDIAKAAGSSRATVYAYFTSKDEIIHALDEEMWERSLELYRAFAALPNWSRESIRGWLRYVTEMWDANLVRTSVAARNQMHLYAGKMKSQHERFVETLMSDAARWKRFNTEEARCRALFLISGLETFCLIWFLGGWELDRKPTLDTLADVWLSTLRVTGPEAKGSA